MKLRAKFSALALITAMTTVPMAVVAPQAAYADRCEPTELVLRTFFGPGYEENFIDERDNPGCYVLLNYVYPRLCDDQSTLNNCIRSANPKPFTPITVAQFSPDAGRVYCSLYLAAATTAGQSTTCTF